VEVKFISKVWKMGNRYGIIVPKAYEKFFRDRERLYDVTVIVIVKPLIEAGRYREGEA